MASGIAPAQRTARFGPFEFDAASAELRKHGVKLRLQGQPLQLLAALLERPGEVVHRTELQKRLWPSDTFVDFDNGLNSAAKRLRAALSDSADSPVYIETLARTGYRFIAPVHAAAEPVPPLRKRLWPYFLVPALACAPMIAYFARTTEQPSFHQVTFRRGPVFGAAFAPDGQSVVFSAQFGTQPRRIYLNNGVSPESRSLGLEGYSLFDVSPKGELALYEYGGTMPTSGGNLLKVPMNGGVPVQVDSGIMSAGWSPDGTQLATVRVANGQSTLEFPPGRALYSTSGWLSSVSFHPGGDRIAFVDHPIRHDDSGVIRVVDLNGGSRAETAKWLSTGGLEWHPNGELWFSATRDQSPRLLWAMREGKAPRNVSQFPGMISLRDIAPNGTVLFSRDTRRLESTAITKDGEHEISWLDWTRAVDVTNDGRVLFDESGEAVAARSATFVRTIGHSEAARIADGQVALGFSPDGTHALTLAQDDRKQLYLYPLGGGKPTQLRATGLEYQWAKYYPDGKHLLALAGQPLRLYRVTLETGGYEAVSEPGMVRYAAISPGGERVAYLTAAGRLMECTGRGRAREVSGEEPLAPIQYSADGRKLFVQHIKGTALPARVSELDLATGTLKDWRAFAPADPTGVDMITRILIPPNGGLAVYTARRLHSELFTAAHLR